jgi:hypothetical protein
MYSESNNIMTLKFLVNATESDVPRPLSLLEGMCHWLKIVENVLFLNYVCAIKYPIAIYKSINFDFWSSPLE